MQFFSLERYRNRYGHNDDIRPMYDNMGQYDPQYMNGRNDMYVEDVEDYDDEYSDDDDYDLESPVSDLDIDISEIDFSKVYAYHTFIANVEGQICVQKDDVLDLLDDTHDYWWLVRCISTNEIGYLPADNIELPFERVARANRFKNVQVASVMPQDKLHRYKERTKKIKFSTSPPIIHMVENREDYEDYDEYGSDDGPFYDDEEMEDNMYDNHMNNHMNMYDNGNNNGNGNMNPSVNMMNNNLNFNNGINLNGPFGGNNIILSTEPFNHSLSLYDHEEKKYLKKGGFFSKLLKKKKKKDKNKRLSDSIPSNYNQGYTMSLSSNYLNNNSLNRMNEINHMNGGMGSLNRMNGMNMNNMNGGMGSLNRMNGMDDMNGGVGSLNRMNGMNGMDDMNGGMSSLNRMNGMNGMDDMNGGMGSLNRINGMGINDINRNEMNNMNYNPLMSSYNPNPGMSGISSLQSFPPRNDKSMFQNNYPSPALESNHTNTPESRSPFEEKINHYGSPQINNSQKLYNKDSPSSYKSYSPGNDNDNIYHHMVDMNKPVMNDHDDRDYPEIELNDEEKENIKKMSNENSEDESQNLDEEFYDRDRKNDSSFRKPYRSERERDRDRDRERDRDRDRDRERDRERDRDKEDKDKEKEKERDTRKELKARSSSLKSPIKSPIKSPLKSPTKSSTKSLLLEKEKDRRKSEKSTNSKRLSALSEKHISVLNPSSSAINIIKVFTGNFDVEQTPYKSVSVNSNTTVKEMIKSALYRFKLPRDTYHDYYMSVIHFDSKEKTLNPNDEVYKILDNIKNKKLPGATKRLSQSVSILSEEDSSDHRLNRNILNDRNIKFILNKKNENSSHCRLVRVFIDQRDESGKKMFKTVGVTSKETAENIIEYALKKFSVLHGKSIDDFVLHAYTRKKLIPIRNSYIIFYLIKQEIEKGSRKVDFVMKEKTERDREREKRKSMRKSRMKAEKEKEKEKENKDKKDRERIKSTISQYATYDDKFDPNETVLIPKLPNKPLKSADKSYSEFSQMSIDMTEEEKEKNNKELTNLLNSLKSKDKDKDKADNSFMEGRLTPPPKTPRGSSLRSKEKGDTSILDGKVSSPLTTPRGRSYSNGSVTMKLNSPGLNSPSMRFGSPALNSPSMRFGSPKLNSPSMRFASLDKPIGRNRSNSETAKPNVLSSLNPRTSSASYKSFSPKLDENNSKVNKNLAKQRLMPIVKPSHMSEVKSSESPILSSIKSSNSEKSSARETSAKETTIKESSGKDNNSKSNIELLLAKSDQIIKSMDEGKNDKDEDDILDDISEVSDDEVIIHSPPQMPSKIQQRRGSTASTSSHVNFDEMLETLDEISINLPDLKEKEKEKAKAKEKESVKKEDEKEKNNKDEKTENQENQEKKEDAQENIGFGFGIGIITNLLKKDIKSDDETKNEDKNKDTSNDNTIDKDKTKENNQDKDKPAESGGSIFDKLKIPTRSTSNDTSAGQSIFDKLKIPTRSTSNNKSNFSPNLNYFKKAGSNTSTPVLGENEKSSPLIKSEQKNENITNKEKDKEVQAVDDAGKAKENLLDVLKEQKSDNEKDKSDRPKKYKSILKAPKEYPMPEELRKLEDLRLEEAKRESSIRHSRRLAERERRKSRSRERLHLSGKEGEEEKEKEKDSNKEIDKDIEKGKEGEEERERRAHSMIPKSHRSSRSASRHHISSRPNERRREKGEEENIEDSEERRRRHASRHASRSHHMSRRLPPETEEERARRHASRRLPPETEEERARRRASRRHVSRRLDAEEERRRRERSEKEGIDEHKEHNLSTISERHRERRSRRMSERHRDHDRDRDRDRENRHRHHSHSTSRSRINISGDILPGFNDEENNKDKDTNENQEVKMMDVANISAIHDQSGSAISSDEIVIPDRALHMEDRLYSGNKVRRPEAGNTSVSSIGSVGSDTSRISHHSTDSNGSHHHHHHRRSRSHSRSSSRDRHISSMSSDAKRRESRHRSTHHRSVRPDTSMRKVQGSPLGSEQDRKSRHEHSHSHSHHGKEGGKENPSNEITSSRVIKPDMKSSGSKPDVSSSLKASHRISSMARPPRIETRRSSLRIDIPKKTNNIYLSAPKQRPDRKSSASSDISINALMDEMRQMMTATPTREPMSPFARELNKLELLQKTNEEHEHNMALRAASKLSSKPSSRTGIENIDINRQGSETYKDHIMHKFNRINNNKRNSKSSISSISAADIKKRVEERKQRYSLSSNASNDNSIGRNIESLKRELEELAIDKEKRRSRLSVTTSITTKSNRSSQISTARNSKFDDTYLKSLLEKLSDTKASKRYSERSSRLINDIARKSISFEGNDSKEDTNTDNNDNKSKDESKEKEEPSTPSARDEENEKLLESLKDCEEKFDSLNKDLNTILFNSVKLFDNLILS